MADSYAYFQVAHKVNYTHLALDISLTITILLQRLIDYVPLTIEHEFNQPFANHLEALLFSSITQESAIPGRLEMLVREDSAMEKRRRRLEARKKDLLKIKQKLDEFWSSGNVANIPGSNARDRRNSAQSEYYSSAE